MPKLILPGKLYEALKWVSLVVIPAAGTLYLTLSIVWGLPFGDQVAKTAIAVEAFLGIVLGISTLQYNASEAKYDGALNVDVNDEGTKVFSLDLGSDPEELDQKDQLIFKVNK